MLSLIKEKLLKVFDKLVIILLVLGFVCQTIAFFPVYALVDYEEILNESDIKNNYDTNEDVTKEFKMKILKLLKYYVILIYMMTQVGLAFIKLT